MTPDPGFGIEQCMTELIRGIIDTVADLPGLTPDQRFIKHQTAAFSLMAFHPRDAVETMLAGHCVIYDHLLRDGAHDLVRGPAEPSQLGARPGTLATGKMFLNTLNTLIRLQKRPAETISVIPATTAAAPPQPTKNDPPPVAAPPAPARAPTVPRSPPPPAMAANVPGIDASGRLPNDGGTRPISFRASLYWAASHAAMPVAARPLGALDIGQANEAVRATSPVPAKNNQAATVSTARTHRAIAPVSEIATGTSPIRQASTA